MKCNAVVAIIFGFMIGITAIGADLPPDPDQMEAQAIETYKKEKKKFNEKRFGERLQKAVNAQVGFGIFRLKKRGFLHAKTLELEWKQFNTHFLNHELNINNIEDHDPALVWLDNFYKTLVSVLGEKSVRSLHLDDIDVFNRGVPVVFAPRGTMQDDYEDCFVRVSAGVGYWGMMLTCTGYQYLGASPTMIFCGPISSATRTAFRLLADPIGNAVWKNANK